MTITGAEGRVQWGYRSAATLRTWLITKNEDSATYLLTGPVSDVDDFAVTQQPLKFVAPNGWRWPITELQIMGASASAVLGPKERNQWVGIGSLPLK